MENNQITIIHDDEEILADILFTHLNEETQKQYVVFQIVGSDEISAARYVQTSKDGGYFEDIETDEEWDELEELLDEYLDSLVLEEDEDDVDEEWFKRLSVANEVPYCKWWGTRFFDW